MPDAVIVSTARTPIGRADKGSLVDVRPDELGAVAVRAALDKIPELDRSTVTDVICGTTHQSGESDFNLGRILAILSDMPEVPGTTVDRACASSLQAIRMAAHAVRAGEGDVFVCAGVETVSRYRFSGTSTAEPNHRFDEAIERTRQRATGAQTWEPSAGLPDMYITMGETAENVRVSENVSRAEMDEFALLSQARAAESQESGFFRDEITPVTTPSGVVVDADDSPRPGTTIEILAGLKPAFRPNGAVTAGNSCPLNDGAAAVVVMSDAKAAGLGLAPLARIVSSGISGLNPEIMGLGPIEACRQALARAGKTIDDIDLVEINEAFAAQVIPSARHLDIPWEKLNTHGGGIALGHPFGMTGARIMTTLLHELMVDDKTWGLESMCVGGGQGAAMVVERLA